MSRITATLAVAILALVAIVGVIVLALQGKPIPPELTTVVTALVSGTLALATTGTPSVVKDAPADPPSTPLP